jgi:hypothetical protein
MRKTTEFLTRDNGCNDRYSDRLIRKSERDYVGKEGTCWKAFNATRKLGGRGCFCSNAEVTVAQTVV